MRKKNFVYCLRILVFVFLFFLFGAEGRLWSQSDYIFRPISLEHGLSNGTIRSVCLDHYGLLWIASSNGLDRYDGEEIRNYTRNSDDSTSLSDNKIHFVIEDSLCNMWIGTDASLLRYDFRNDHFLSVPAAEDAVYFGVLLLPDQVIFASDNHLLFYRYADRSFRRLYFTGEKLHLSGSHRLLLKNRQTLLLGSRWNGLWECDLTTGLLSPSRFYTDRSVQDMLLDSSGHLWISSFYQGVLTYTLQGDCIRHIPLNSPLLQNNMVRDLSLIDGREIWMATDGGGVVLYDMDKQVYSQLQYDVERRNILPSNSLTLVHQDYQNNVWLGTTRNGLFSRRHLYATSYLNDHANGDRGFGEVVTSLCEQPSGRIWVALDGDGIHEFLPSKGTLVHYPSTRGAKITSMVHYSDHEMLVGIYRSGLYLFSSSGQLRPYPMPGNLNQRLRKGWFSIHLQRLDNYSFLLSADSLYRFQISQKEPLFTAFPGGESGLIFAVSPRKDRCLLYSLRTIYSYVASQHRLAKIGTLPDKYGEIRSVQEDHWGRIWIATYRGLVLLNSSTGEIAEVEYPDLKNINALYCTSDSALWIGSSGKLFRYSANDRSIQLFDRSDGVSPNLFIGKSFLESSEGSVYMGGINGFTRIDRPIQRKPSSVHARLWIQDVIVDGVRLPGGFDLYPRRIEIPATHSSITLHLNVKGGDLCKRNIIRYRIEGLQEQFQTIDHSRITLHALPPGSYTIEGECVLPDGRLSELHTITTLHVLPHWWQTWWFISLVLLMVVSLIGYILYLMRQMQRRRLRRLVKLREKELYEQKLRFLININHELRTPLMLVLAPVERLLSRESRLSEEVKTTLVGVSRQARRMRDVIDMVLDIRKMEVIENQPDCSAVDLNKWVETICSEFRAEFESKRIELSFVPCPSIESFVLDQNKMQKVLYNLLSNALKFSIPDTQVQVLVEMREMRLRISVSDQGKGLKDLDAEKLFGRFYQGVHHQGGSGIGLSYSRTLMEMQGGVLNVMPNTHCGATFYLELPLSTPLTLVNDSDEAIAPFDSSVSVPPLPPAVDLSAFSVLVVENEIDLNNLIVATLTPLFKHVYRAYDGKDALDQTLRYHPHIVVSDVLMPRMSGFEYCRLLRSIQEISHTPVVLLTALGNQEDIIDAYRLGADIFLPKPFDMETLITVLANILLRQTRPEQRSAHPALTLLPDELEHSESDRRFLEGVIQVIRSHISDPNLSLDFIRQEMSVSRSVLYDKVKRLTGKGVHDMINSIRIKKAMLLLKDTDLSIIDISERVGIKQPQYFSTLFKRETGMTPSEFRKTG